MTLFRLLSLATARYLRLLGARRERLRLGDVSLVYYDIGREDAEPWVLLHGLGSVAASWSPVMRGLRRSCRMLVPELSALGGTEAPGHGLGVKATAEVLTELMAEKLGDRPVTLVGLSLGGWAAVRLALAHPERVARLVLIDAGGYRDQDWDKIESLVTLEDLAGVDRLYTALFVRVPWMMRISRSVFLKAYTSPSVRNVLAGLTEDDTFDDADLARLRMPVELIWAEGDGLFTLETARAMAAALPNAHLEVLPGCGHAAHLERPRALVAALQRFRRAQQVESATGGDPWQARSTSSAWSARPPATPLSGKKGS
ncbi:MAG TPA: alpha/beta hydrolase [Thermoanaerobaculia bacterium]|nr:alpha/beta hydrolase [Thermoanaerobaculia bacterium]